MLLHIYRTFVQGRSLPRQGSKTRAVRYGRNGRWHEHGPARRGWNAATREALGMHAGTWLTGMQRKPSITHLMLIPWPKPHITRSILSSFGQVRFTRPGAAAGLLAAGLSRSIAPFLFPSQDGASTAAVDARYTADWYGIGNGTGNPEIPRRSGNGHCDAHKRAESAKHGTDKTAKPWNIKQSAAIHQLR